MNTAEYISSGILEAYVLGNLEPAEREEVELNLARYPELKSELDIVEKSMEELMLKAGRQPRPRVKARIMNSISNSSTEAPVIPLNANKVTQTWKYAAAASFVLALTSAGLAYMFWSNWKQAETQLSELVAQNQQIALDYNTVNQRLNKIEEDLNIYDNPGFKKVIMKGMPSAPDAMASVYWNESTEEVYLSIQNLKTLSQEKQYQLWAIVDGEAHDMGMFDSDMKGLVRMKPGTGITAFAVTIEPRGGQAAPTMETMQVFGKTKS
jgi:anti-sigma-K factor RskA